MVTTLVEIWELFDFACGQRLVAALRSEGAAVASGRSAEVQRRGGRETEEDFRQHDRSAAAAGEADAACESAALEPGCIRCCIRRSRSKWRASGIPTRLAMFRSITSSTVGDRAAGSSPHRIGGGYRQRWWEGEAIPARTQEATQEALDRIRKRAPFRMREIHPDNDHGLINDLLWRYCRQRHISCPARDPTRRTTTPGWNSAIGRTCGRKSATAV